MYHFDPVDHKCMVTWHRHDHLWVNESVWDYQGKNIKQSNRSFFRTFNIVYVKCTCTTAYMISTIQNEALIWTHKHDKCVYIHQIMGALPAHNIAV